MNKLLLVLKICLLLALSSSFYWLQNIDISNICRLLMVLLCGVLIPLVWSSSVAAPSFSFTLRGIANRIPVSVWFVTLPILSLIPLGFHTELMDSFRAWVEFLRNFPTFTDIFTENGIELIKQSIPLLLAGMYLFLIILLSQVASKAVIDYFFDSPS